MPAGVHRKSSWLRKYACSHRTNQPSDTNNDMMSVNFFYQCLFFTFVTLVSTINCFKIWLFSSIITISHWRHQNGLKLFFLEVQFCLGLGLYQNGFSSEGLSSCSLPRYLVSPVWPVWPPSILVLFARSPRTMVSSLSSQRSVCSACCRSKLLGRNPSVLPL